MIVTTTHGKRVPRITAEPVAVWRDQTEGNKRGTALSRDEFQAYPIATMTFSGWGRPIIKDVPQMRSTATAMTFGARAEQFAIHLGSNGIGHGAGERRPPGAAIELVLGSIKRQIAAPAHKRACALFVI